MNRKTISLPNGGRLLTALAFFMTFSCLHAVTVAAQEDSLRVISFESRSRSWFRYTDMENSLYRHLSGLAFEQLADRSREVAKLRSADDWRHRQAELRRIFDDMIGPFPEKTPLNPKTTGVLEKDGYHVEKILFESSPGYYVTSALFVPEGLRGKAPAVLFCVGHSAAAFRRPLYQHVVLNLVKKGFVVLAVEPIGQGERLQYFDPESGESLIGGSTLEHSYPAAQYFIAGNAVATRFIWDGIRCIDYLLTRDEVDPDRIGCHGLSGGGTQSSYIAAFDERVKAVAPAGFITNLTRLFESVGPQDGEQNMYLDIASGIDHADILAVRAPKPALIVATTRDFFSIQGSRETYDELVGTYSALGERGNIAITEDDYGHGYTKKNREAVYAFFQKHLDLPGDPTDEEVEYLSYEELTITKTGQISTSLNSKTAFDLNAADGEKLVKDLKNSRNNLDSHLKKVRTKAAKLSGYHRPSGVAEPVFTGRHHREGYFIEKYFIRGEGDYIIPFVLLLPEKDGPHPAVIYIHPEGKLADIEVGGSMDSLARRGYAVLAPDLVGTGETGPGQYQGDAYEFKVGKANYNLWFAGLRTGRSIAGLRAADTVRLTDFLAGRADIQAADISAVAVGTMCPVLLHAAAFETAFSRVALIEPLVSYRSLVMNRYYSPSCILNSVAASLTAYDLPDLAACIAPRELTLVNVLNHNGEPADSEMLGRDTAVIHAAYKKASKEDKLRVLQTANLAESLGNIFTER